MAFTPGGAELLKLIEGSEVTMKRLEARVATLAKQAEGHQKTAVSEADLKNALNKIDALDKRIKSLEVKVK